MTTLVGRAAECQYQQDLSAYQAQKDRVKQPLTCSTGLCS